MRRISFAKCAKFLTVGFVLNTLLTIFIVNVLLPNYNTNTNSNTIENMEDFGVKKISFEIVPWPTKNYTKRFLKELNSTKHFFTTIRAKMTRNNTNNKNKFFNLKKLKFSNQSDIYKGYHKNVTKIKNNLNFKKRQSAESNVSYLFPSSEFLKTSDDRILQQLNFKINSSKNDLKRILFIGKSPPARDLNMANCNVQNCRFTNRKDDFIKSDAVIFTSTTLASSKSFTKQQNQVWAFYQLESPGNPMTSSFKQDSIDFTLSYRRDSVIVTPYEKFVPYSSQPLFSGSDHINNASKRLHTNHFNQTGNATKRNYAKGKTKMAAWFVSNCHPKNGRNFYVAELQKYISVDIYGQCGSLQCTRRKGNDCFQMLNRDYKFYLAFENSNCVDYITEKLYWNGLNNNVIPIVMGARKQDYLAVVPEHSIIHVDDFKSPKDLANYLKALASDDELFNSYFKWKGTGEFINTRTWCRVCAMVNAAQDYRMYYPNVRTWWQFNGVCKRPVKHRWSTWVD